MPKQHNLIYNLCSIIREIDVQYGNKGETLTKRDNITINIDQESYECACIIDLQLNNSYNALVQ